MKITRAIHPELIAGLRGDPSSIERYRSMLKEVRFQKEGSVLLKGGVLSKSFYFRRALGLEGEQYTDWILMRFLSMMQDWRMTTRRSYYIGKDFAETLRQVDLKIPMRSLPDSFFGYIAFPPDTIFDEEEAVQGCYVRIGRCKELSIAINGAEPDTRFLWICAISQQEDCKHSDMLYALPNEDIRLEDLLFQLQQAEWADYIHTIKDGRKTPVDEDTQRKRSIVFRSALNAVIYTQSEGASLMNCVSERLLTHKKRIEARASGNLTNCTVPLTLIHPNYHRAREIHVNETFVRSHPRWQPCGAGLSNVKLIWVREHKRSFGARPSLKEGDNLGRETTSSNLFSTRKRFGVGHGHRQS